jgi:hypothetical protein
LQLGERAILADSREVVLDPLQSFFEALREFEPTVHFLASRRQLSLRRAFVPSRLPRPKRENDGERKGGEKLCPQHRDRRRQVLLDGNQRKDVPWSDLCILELRHADERSKGVERPDEHRSESRKR